MLLQGQNNSHRFRPLLTRRNLIWLLIIVLTILTIAVTIWASKQPNLSVDPGPPLS